MKIIIIFLALFISCGCSSSRFFKTENVDPPQDQSGRMKVISVQTINERSEGRREVIILSDSITGKAYLVVTGTGITELMGQENKNK